MEKDGRGLKGHITPGQVLSRVVEEVGLVVEEELVVFSSISKTCESGHISKETLTTATAWAGVGLRAVLILTESGDMHRLSFYMYDV